MESEFLVNFQLREIEMLYNDNGVEHFFKCAYLERVTGVFVVLPFFSSVKPKRFEGYLIYHYPDKNGMSESELRDLGMIATSKYSPIGAINGKLALPFAPLKDEDVDEVIENLIKINTSVNLSMEKIRLL